MITGTYNLVVNPEWRNVQQQDVFLECDTTLAPVIINLFEIADLNRFWNVKIIISDVNSNAATNNITINSDGSDNIDESGTNQVIINSNGSSVSFQVASETQWLAVESKNAGATAPYKVYTALLTQTGTNAPVATVLENNLGVDIVWTYDGNGFSIGTTTSFLNPVFTNGKTFFLINSDVDSNYTLKGQSYYSLFYGDEWTVYINTYFIDSSNIKEYSSNMLSNTSIEIRVYN